MPGFCNATGFLNLVQSAHGQPLRVAALPNDAQQATIMRVNCRWFPAPDLNLRDSRTWGHSQTAEALMDVAADAAAPPASFQHPVDLV